MAAYAKAITACVTALFTILTAFGMTDAAGNIFGLSQEAVIAVAVPLITTIMTYWIPNKPS